MKNLFLFSLLTFGASLGAATISLSPDSVSAAVGTEVELNVLVDQDVKDLYSYQFSILFDPAYLRAETVTEGALFFDTGNSIFLAPVIDNTAGTISNVANLFLGAINGVDGPGSLASLKFTILQAGISTVRFSQAGDLLLYDSSLNLVEATASDADITGVVPEPGTFSILTGPVLLLALRRRATSLPVR